MALFIEEAKETKKPGLKGPSAELILAVIEMKQRNPRRGCRKIAEQLSRAFGIEVNKDVVRDVFWRSTRSRAKAVRVLTG